MMMRMISGQGMVDASSRQRYNTTEAGAPSLSPAAKPNL
jgi:hypothetical protein